MKKKKEFRCLCGNLSLFGLTQLVIEVENAFLCAFICASCYRKAERKREYRDVLCY